MKNNEISEMWNNRYSSPEYAYGKKPNDFLKSQAEHIPMGKVLCLGAGEGRNAVFLAQLGYQVTALDISETGLLKAQQLAKKYNVTINTIHGDIEDFVIEKNEWQAITSIFFHTPPFMRKDIHKNIVAGLAPGGVFILEGYSKNQLQYKTGGPPVIDLLFDLQEIRNELDGMELKVSQEVVRSVVEGQYHTGQGSVIQIVGIK